MKNRILSLIAIVFAVLAIPASATSHHYIYVSKQAQYPGAGPAGKQLHAFGPVATRASAPVVVYLDTTYGVSNLTTNPGSAALLTSDFLFNGGIAPPLNPNLLPINRDSIVCFWTLASKYAKIDSASLGIKYKVFDSTYSTIGTPLNVALASGATVTARVAAPYVYGGQYLPYVAGVTTLLDSVLVLGMTCGDR